MNHEKYLGIVALLAMGGLFTGCQATPPERTDSRVVPVTECEADRGRQPRGYLVVIHVGERGDQGGPGRRLAQEGSTLIAPGEAPRFQVVRRGNRVPPGKVRIRYESPGGSAQPETPFVDTNGAKVHEFVVTETDERRQHRPGEPWQAPLRARSTCDAVCTFDVQCKYSILYEPDDGRGGYRELDPYTIVH